LKAVLDVNEKQPLKLIELLKKHIPELKGRKIGVLGLAFKPETDDIRETRAIPVIKALIDEGANVVAYDPKAIDAFRKIFPEVEYAPSEKVLESEAILIVTEWEEFESIDYRGKIVIDGRIIPAAGFGTRMLPITKAQPKEMVPVVHKPVIQYVVEEAYYSGIRDILIITGRGKRAIEDHFDRSDMPKKERFTEELDRILEEVNIFFVRQKKQKGLGDAVSYAESFMDDEPFALLLGDTITFPPCTKELIETYNRYKTSIIAVEEVPVEKVSLYGIVACKEIENRVYLIDDLTEKPKQDEAPSNLAILGRYILTPEIFDCIRKTKPGKGNEIQLTDAMKILNTRERMYAYLFKGRRYDIGNKLDWLKANIELAVNDEEVGEEVRRWLSSELIQY
jgi:UTP--glucose-1-phosphate uridylyltransferase